MCIPARTRTQVARIDIRQRYAAAPIAAGDSLIRLQQRIGKDAREPLVVLHKRRRHAFGGAFANTRQAAQGRYQVIEGSQMFHLRL
jgi:hypothetical protein